MVTRNVLRLLVLAEISELRFKYFLGYPYICIIYLARNSGIFSDCYFQRQHVMVTQAMQHLIYLEKNRINSFNSVTLCLASSVRSIAQNL